MEVKHLHANRKDFGQPAQPLCRLSQVFLVCTRCNFHVFLFIYLFFTTDTFLQGGVKRKKKTFSPAPWKKRKFDNKSVAKDKSQKTSGKHGDKQKSNKQHKFNKTDKADFNSKQSNKGETDKRKTFDKDSETKKKGKKAGMTPMQRLHLKKKLKLRKKEKKLPKYKRKPK